MAVRANPDEVEAGAASTLSAQSRKSVPMDTKVYSPSPNWEASLSISRIAAMVCSLLIVSCSPQRSNSVCSSVVTQGLESLFAFAID